MDGDPVQVEGAIGGGRRSEARVSDEDIPVEDADELIVVRVIEDLERHGDLRLGKDTSGADNGLNSRSVGWLDGSDSKRNAHRSPPAKSCSSGAAGMPDSCCASAQPSG